jgi:hypothetical protein
VSKINFLSFLSPIDTNVLFADRIYTRALLQTKERLQKNANLPAEQIYTPVFRRGIFTVGLLMRFFDFSRADVNGSNTNERSEKILIF